MEVNQHFVKTFALIHILYKRRQQNCNEIHRQPSPYIKKIGMTCAKNWTYRMPEIQRNGSESTFPLNFGTLSYSM